MPGAPAVNWKVPPLASAPESNVVPSSADTVWDTSSSLVQVTDVPLATLRFGGTYAKFWMATVEPPPELVRLLNQPARFDRIGPDLAELAAHL